MGGSFDPAPLGADPPVLDDLPPARVFRMAGFWHRFAALLIDLSLDLAVVGLFMVPALLTVRLLPREMRPCTVGEQGDIGFGGRPNATCRVASDWSPVLVATFLVVALVAIVIYYGTLEGGPSGQTVGKRVLGIRVVDKVGGGPIGTSRGVGRWFARLLSTFSFGLGYLWMLWDPQMQTWHDKVVDSYVVYVAKA
jgi:uncharacterized RDD family membrane protein YckC